MHCTSAIGATPTCWGSPWVRRVDDVGMTIEDNKTVVRRFIDALFTEGDLEATDDYLSDDFVNHDSPLGLPRRGRTAAS
jgi:hypothetical protein